MKLIFIDHPYHLPDSSLTKQIYNRQVAEGLPGLIQENAHHLENINFETTKFLSKYQFRKVTKAYVTDLCKSELIQDSMKYKKISHESLSKEEFKRKDYFQQLSLGQARDRLRLRAQMFGDLKGSFPSKFRRQGTSLKCRLCEVQANPSIELNTTSEDSIETQNHFLELCPLVSDLKDIYDTETDLGLVQFFRAVLQRRAENENYE